MPLQVLAPCSGAGAPDDVSIGELRRGLPLNARRARNEPGCALSGRDASLSLVLAPVAGGRTGALLSYPEELTDKRALPSRAPAVALLWTQRVG